MRQRLPEKRLEGDFIAVLIAFEIRKPPIPEAVFGLPANEAEPEGNWLCRSRVVLLENEAT